MAAYGLYTHIQSNRHRSIALLIGLFFLIYVLVFAGALMAEAEDAGEQRRRELLDAGVIFLHRVVVEAARSGELVLDVGDLALQLLKALVGLQIRIGFR